jgi:hypothetical protein
MKSSESTYVKEHLFWKVSIVTEIWNNILGGGEGDSTKVFKMQKRVLRVTGGLGKRESCRQVFKDYGILMVTSLYILEVLCYIKKHKADLIQNMNILWELPTLSQALANFTVADVIC